MSMAALRWARAVRGISPTQKLVLVMLADAANDYGECWPSAVVLAADCCLSERAVREAFGVLEEVGLIEGERSEGRATRWRVVMGATPARPTCPPARDTLTPAARSALRADRRHPGNGRAGGADGSGGGMQRVPPPPADGSDRTLKNPHTTPKEPPDTRGKRQPPLVLLPPWLPEPAWQAWCHHRRGKRWTDHAAALSIRTLTELREQGNDPVAVIEQSIASGWTGLFPLKQRGAQQRDRQADQLDWMREEAADIASRRGGAAP